MQNTTSLCSEFEATNQSNHIFEFYGARTAEEGGMESKKSFVPQLGKIVPKISAALPNSESSLWDAYIYVNNEGKQIGYLRIPTYLISSEKEKENQLENLEDIISYLDIQTDALVIDQVSNGGGHESVLKEVLSMLSPSPLIYLKEKLKITQADVYEAYKKLEYIDSIIKKHTDRDGEIDDDEDPDFEDLGLEGFLKWKKIHEYLIDEWNAGKTLTHSFYFGDVFIEPHEEVQYTKPIVVLINELDFSCADVLPAILQDNRRAVLFGNRTAGAGGGVKKVSFINQHGIGGINYTNSLIERQNHQKIENLGIIPDVEYVITAEDIQNRYVNYGKAVNKVVSSLLQGE